MDKLVYLEEGYNLTENPYALPEKFMREAKCLHLFVEFLKTTTEQQPVQEKKKAANHAVFKLVFEKNYEDFAGLRLEMAVNYNYKSKSETSSNGPVKYKSGYLCAKPTLFSRPSSKTASTCELAIARNWPVGSVIRLLLHFQMSHFDFVNLQDRYFGCRDFVSQAIHVLHKQGFILSCNISRVLSGPSLPVTGIYDALGLRFAHRGRVLMCPIDKGRFTVYQRHESSAIPYKGSHRAHQLAAFIPEA
ncbi:uncharacterized protein MAM_00887 [Metarhizium album ARSEF 1941]|uniref:Uncharacterized protein n=1 Tax=Metarhizium album (strain ARSEF 1941) TaxID=1081103 RepID=A0A0B2X9A1_METAS|nr:uncharacterized protein MAM_00887 [Metarhizium album ARSEF 1941]KHO01886.1 hypothetical protein MAM_00887 [Metarhizium album ARSEF 1941]